MPLPSSARTFAAMEYLALIGVLLGPAPLASQAPGRPLVTATREVPPFAMLDDRGQWAGISIDLWQIIAARLELPFDIQVMSLADMLAAVEQGRVDVAVGALTITAAREESLDFTHAFYSSGLGIAVATERAGIVTAVLRALLSPTLLKALAGLSLLLLVAGGLVWLFERQRNAEQFGGGPWKGLGAGFWWAAVTMTTVGYGDKAPRTVAGRVVALIWMFASIITISAFTAGIATALTIRQLDTSIDGPEDLPNHTVGTVSGSTSESYLIRRGVRRRTYDSVTDALAGLAGGDLEAVVYDAPLLRYHANVAYAHVVRVLPRTFERQNYALALPPNSPLREPINRVLLATIAGTGWTEIVNRYLGSEE